MLLENKVAVVHGAGGALGGAIARAFAGEGARVFLAGRTLAKVEAVARAIAHDGGRASAAPVDALDEDAVERHAASVVREAGRIDVAFDAVGMHDVQGTGLLDMPVGDVLQPILAGARSKLLTARAAARHMAARGSGVVLTITAGPPEAVSFVGGFGSACEAIEGLWRTFASELGPRGVRFICLRSAGSPDTPDMQRTFELHAQATGTSYEECLASFASSTLLGRLPLSSEVASMAAVLASDRARALTGAFVHVTCGSRAG